MTLRSSRETVSFHRPFKLKGFDAEFAAGDYVVETDEEAIEGNSRTIYRRVATRLLFPAVAVSLYPSSIFTIDPNELAAARANDGVPNPD